MNSNKTLLTATLLLILFFFGCTAHLFKHHPNLAEQLFEKRVSKSEKQARKHPRNSATKLEACKNLTMYGHVFVLRESEIMEEEDFSQSREFRLEASGLFQNAYNYGLESLDILHPGFQESFHKDSGVMLGKVTIEQVDYLYWTAAALGSMISTAKGDPYAIADLPKVGILIDRAMELNESYDKGSLHEFMISFVLSRPDSPSDAIEIAKNHFDKAVILSGGNRASAFVTYAESICTLEQDRSEFLSMLNRALEVDVNADPDLKLSNIVSQERAAWLKERVDDLFF